MRYMTEWQYALTTTNVASIDQATLTLEPVQVWEV